MLGAPGSGKNEMNIRLRKAHDYCFIETGDVFRGLDESNPSDACIIRIINAGGLVPDDTVCDVVFSRLDKTKDILTDGFPRTRPQAERLMNWANENGYRVRAILLNITRDQAIARIALRVAKGGRRRDDTDRDVINRRLDAYYEKTEPMADYLRHAPNVELIEIDAWGTIDEVFERILKQL
jgi:adenylate kinase